MRRLAETEMRNGEFVWKSDRLQLPNLQLSLIHKQRASRGVASPPSAVHFLRLEAVQWCCASRTVVVNPEQRNPQRQAC